jgi:hypothetical protein
MGRTPHIVNVSIPAMTAIVASALLEGNLAAVVDGLGSTVTVIVSFGDGSVYRYPDVPALTAAGVARDPEGHFENIRYWPGYRRIT